MHLINFILGIFISLKWSGTRADGDNMGVLPRCKVKFEEEEHHGLAHRKEVAVLGLLGGTKKRKHIVL